MFYATKRIENTRIQKNGGFQSYWTLVPRTLKQLPLALKLAYEQIDQKLKNSTLRLLYKIYLTLSFLLLLLFKIPWWLFIKPLGKYLFYIKSIYKVSLSDKLITDYTCEVIVYLFCLPIFYIVRHRPSKKDLKYLFKEDAENIKYLSQRGRIEI